MHITTRIPLKRPKTKWGYFGDINNHYILVNINFHTYRLYAESIQRPFGVRYNPYTQSVEVLSSAKRITAVVCELRGDLSIVSAALKKVSALDHNLDVDKISQMLHAGLQVSVIFRSENCIIIVFNRRLPTKARSVQIVRTIQTVHRRKSQRMMKLTNKNAHIYHFNHSEYM